MHINNQSWVYAGTGSYRVCRQSQVALCVASVMLSTRDIVHHFPLQVTMNGSMNGS